MSSSWLDLSEKLGDVESFKVGDAVAYVHNQDSTTVDAVCSQMMNATKRSEDVENVHPSSPEVKERENMIETEVVIQENLDGLYSWVIVCASFVNCFIVGTMFIGFSILYVEISEYFGSSKGVAGWIGSLYMASGNVFGEKCHNLCFFIIY